MEHADATPLRDGEGRPRAGWRVLIAWVGFVLVEWGLGLGLELALRGLPEYALLAAAAVSRAAALIAFVVLVRRGLDRRPLAGLGLRPSPLFLLGFLLVGVALAAAMCLELALGWVRPHPLPAPTPALLGGTVFDLVVVIWVGQALPEEALFRGYVLRNLLDSCPVWVAWTGTALLFGVLHVMSQSGATRVGERLAYAGAVVIGLGLATTAARLVTGNIWMGVGIHTGYLFLTGLSPLVPAGPAWYVPGLLLVGAATGVLALAIMAVGWRGRRAAASPTRRWRGLGTFFPRPASRR